MTKKEIAEAAIKALKKEYKEAICSLEYKDPFQLLVATRLAAQCTDARVNKATPALFKKYKDSKKMSKAKIEDVEELIKTCGMYKTKAKDLVNLSIMIEEEFGGQVPDNMEDLISLPGIGRKTANLVLGDIFKVEGSVVVDTHCIRITRRLGLHNETDQKKIEFILRDLLPKKESSDFCHRLVLHGREVCTARKAKCDICCMKDFCKKKI